VGKTTCAAAAAIAAAERTPDARVLLISIDPAHSLADALGVALSDAAVGLAGAPANLAARELDAARVFDNVRRKYAEAIDQIFARLGAGKGFDVTHDRSVMHGLIDLAPPGLDELASVIEIMESATSDNAAWDLVVIDTAPTGHALRLLETPTLIHDWTKALMSILLKYQPVAGIGELGALLLKMSRGLGRLKELLADADRSAFVVVTRPAALPREESVRLLARLEKLHVAVPAVIVNAVGRGTCARCRTADAAETRELAAIRRAVQPRATGRAVVTAGRRIPGPAGVTELREWQRSAWRT
jgi:arsenite-transporting ATPase